MYNPKSRFARRFRTKPTERAPPPMDVSEAARSHLVDVAEVVSDSIVYLDEGARYLHVLLHGAPK